MSEDIICYAKIYGILLIPSIWVFMLLSLDFTTDKAFLWTFFIYTLSSTLGVLMFNYLEYGVFRFRVSDEDRDDPHSVKRDYESYKRKRKDENLYDSQLFGKIF